MWGLSIWHWLIVVGVVTVLFGRNAVSRTMHDIGKGMREMRGMTRELIEGDNDREHK